MPQVKRTRRQTTIEVLRRAISHCEAQTSALEGFDAVLATETKHFKQSLENRLSKLLYSEQQKEA